MKLSFLSYYAAAFLRPSHTFARLLHTKHKLRYAFYAVLLQAVVYTCVYIFLVMGDGRPFKPWLSIPPEDYYWYNRFFLAPSMLLAWIAAAGVAQLFGKAFHGKGSFEDTLCVFGFGTGIASWATGLHDLATSFLGALHIINPQDYELALNTPTVWRILLWVLMTAYLLWFCLLFSKGVMAVHHIRPGGAAITGITGFLVYQLLFFIFNR
jgi:Yip1 domain